jgi:hypothetical protein
MATLDTAHPATPPADPARLIAVIGLALTLSYVTFLVAAALQGHWIVDLHGRPIASDFLGFWTAGRLALDGQAALSYDWEAHRALTSAAAGQPLDSFYPWLYPPPYLFVAALFALLPAIPASIAWLACTLPLYVASVRAIVGPRAGVLFACGWPGALWTATAGQNGFLTAALMGGTLALMRRHPLASGACLGLMTIKPQFGLLFPLALIAAAQWRVIASAAAVALALATASALVFGIESWRAFFEAAPAAQHLNFALGGAGFAKWQSVFGAVRWLGGSQSIAWSVYGIVVVGLAAATWCVWRSDAPFDLKAALLSVGALLATPYLFIYDLAALAVPAAFLVRHALAEGFRTSEIAGLVAAAALLLIYIALPVPVGLAATLIVAALVVSRLGVWRRAKRPRSHPDNLVATG